MYCWGLHEIMVEWERVNLYQRKPVHKMECTGTSSLLKKSAFNKWLILSPLFGHQPGPSSRYWGVQLQSLQTILRPPLSKFLEWFGSLVLFPTTFVIHQLKLILWNSSYCTLSDTSKDKVFKSGLCLWK